MTLLIPNIGSEEGLGFAPGDTPGPFAQAAELGDIVDPVLQTAALWRMLFGSEARFEASCTGALTVTRAPAFWPADFGAQTPEPVFGWLDVSAAAWLNTADAERIARERGCPLLGAPSATVSEVHDKAFAHSVAVAERLLPPSLDSLIEVIEPAALRDATGARGWIVDSVERWPDWTQRRFTLKPRFGTSGRGRVAGTGDRIAAGEGGFRRLAQSGGAMLEPWLRRTCDLSAQMWIQPDGQVVLLGTTELVVAPSGLYRGHRGTVDSRGRVHSASRFDEPLREAAVAVARAAFSAGYFGPCGVDAFAFLADDREVFRPVVEFNARFTLGTVVVGLLRRALPRIREVLSLGPGELRSFYFGLGEPECGWHRSDRGLLVLLSSGDEPDRPPDTSERGPGLFVAIDREDIDRYCAPRSAPAPDSRSPAVRE